MFLLYWYPLGSILVAAVVAFSVTLIAARRSPARLRTGARWAAALGAALALAVGALPDALTLNAIASMLFDAAFLPEGDWRSVFYDTRFLAAPLGGIAALLLWLPATGRGGAGHRSGSLAPRTLLTFAPRPLTVAFAALTAVAILSAVIAGSLSSRDEHGRFTRFVYYTVETGSGASGIYGWNDSLPAIAAIAALFGMTVLVLHRVSRPPLAPDAELDAAERRRTAGSVLLISIGAVCAHLTHVLLSFRNTVGSSFSLSPEQGSWIEISSPFAVFMPALTTAAFITHFCGGYAWFRVLWRGLLDGRLRRGAPAPGEGGAGVPSHETIAAAPR